ncbi:hypothetical protein DL96DRAFT_1633078 [Flagelloscypha sp. PMI_526]|nr:hypothetical protein DL96DRAFT_1633078 [Flagelloscypha sp. PMI_526]
MPSVRSLRLNRLEDETPWEIIRSTLEDVILPQLHYLSIWCVYDAPVWVVSSCHQLNELYLNDCPSVLDDASVVSIRQVNPLPLRYLRISELSNELFDFLCRSVTQLEALELPIYEGVYETACDRVYMPLRRLPALMKPMVNTLVCLDIDAWPILHFSRPFSLLAAFFLLIFIYVGDRKVSDHPFFVGQYPHLRYFYIGLGVSLDLAEDDDGLVAENLETQLTWLSNMLQEEPSFRPHPLGYIGISLYNWWALEHTNQAVKKVWGELDLALAGDQSIARAAYPNLKELQLSPKTTAKHGTEHIKNFYL